MIWLELLFDKEVAQLASGSRRRAGDGAEDAGDIRQPGTAVATGVMEGRSRRCVWWMGRNKERAPQQIKEARSAARH